jgi:hypothetical protein
VHVTLRRREIAMARELLAIRLRVSESQFGVIRFADFDNVRLEWKRRRPASTRP